MRRQTIYRIITIILLVFAVLYVSRIKGEKNEFLWSTAPASKYLIPQGVLTVRYPSALHRLYFSDKPPKPRPLLETHLHKDTNNTDTILTCGTIQPEINEPEIDFKFPSSTVITIPVVFHVVWNTSAQNIPDQRLYDQLDALNRDFRRTNWDTTNAPAIFNTVGADTEVEFCLAVRDPNGNPTTGITRTQTTVTSFTTNAVKFDAQGGKDGWNRDKYMNFWVAPLGNNLGGWAQFPCGTASTDGIVVQYWTVGDSLGGNYNKGRVAVHEAGHWLNLRHINGDANCGNDFCNDTPPQAALNFGCPTYPKISCGNSGEMTMNYMDYTNDWCKSIFTQDQKTRILNTLNGCRVSLLTSDGCVPVNTPNPPVITALNTNICIGEYSQFTTTSFNPVWSSSGGTIFGGTTSSAIQVHFLNSGTFYVKLTTSGGSDSVAVTVSSCPKVQNIYTNWKMGREVSVTFFTSGAKIAGESKLTGIEACQGISDAFGNLLFSTDFRKVWDENGNLVASNLIGSPNSPNYLVTNHISATSGLVLPSLTAANIYYIICVSDMGVNQHGLVWYTYNSQTKTIFGAVYADTNFPITEGISATRHCYGNGWIIAAHGKGFSGTVFNWNGQDVSDKIITWYFQDGLNWVMNINNSFDIPSSGYGQMKFSPDGSQLAVGETSTGRVELYSFDREFGIATYVKYFQYFSSTFQGSGYGLEFSPDGYKLYTTGGYSLTAIKCLVQWDVISGAMTLLNCTGWPGQLQLGVDNKIYVSTYGQNGYGVIQSPNLAGFACGYVTNGIWAYLPTVRFTTYGLPNCLTSINATVGWCFSVPLPVALLSFEGYQKGNYNLLEWVTGSEQNNDYFILEKLVANSILSPEHWIEIARIKGAGNSSTAKNYSFKDYKIQDKNYYRLKQVDFDGKEKIFDKVVYISVKTQKGNEIIFNVFGQKMSNSLEDLPAGVYFIKNDFETKKIVVVK